MTNEPWDGTERRAADKRLAAAVNEVHDLRSGVADLAEAVRIKTIEFQKVVRQVAILLAVLFVLLVTFSLWQDSRLTDELDHGHDRITCLLLIEPSQRTAQSLIDCQRGGG